ncbi:ABC transporter permease [Clostridia bacterium]|nr:ABC transporter permease [Clostridia bacterium]
MSKPRSKLNIIFFSVVIGFLAGGIILKLAGYSPIEVYFIMLKGTFGSLKFVSYGILKATPLILTGLSVMFAFRTGLFNIGAEGQFIVGSIVAASMGYYLHLPAIIHPIVILVIATIAGGLWGGIAGFFKAKFGVNEVISTIMLNWIALYLSNYVVAIESFARRTNVTHSIQSTASIRLLGEWKKTEAGLDWLSGHPMLFDLFKTQINFGIVVAILAVVLSGFILNKTTLGYSLKAVGYNKHAAEFGGIDVKKKVFTSMFIAGAISGLAGALQVLGVSQNLSTLAAMEGYGFDGIAVALMGANTPLGCLFSGLFFGALKYGGTKIQTPPINAPSETVNIMVGIIVLFIAMPKLFDVIKKKLAERKRVKMDD